MGMRCKHQQCCMTTTAIKMKRLGIYPCLAILLLFVHKAGLSDDLPPKDKLCPNNDCRGPITIKLTKEDGSIFERKYDYLYPIVQSGAITVLPGENIKITGAFENNKLTQIRALKESDQGIPLITFSFNQQKTTMLLTVVNNSKQSIKYHLAMMPLKEGKLIKTSSCPVLAGTSAFETWPFPIYQLVIVEISCIETTKKMKCEY